MRITPTVDVIAGTTLKATWVNSGAAPSAIFSTLLDASDTMVSSFAAVSSGNGFYFALHTVPNSAQWLINEWQATVDGNLYRNRQLIRVRTLEVD